MKNKFIAVTFGNPNGIGPEICAKALSRFKPALLERFVLIGERESYEYYFKGKSRCAFIQVEVPAGVLYRFNPGERDPASGLLSWLFLKRAVTMVKNGEADGLVTAPISKELTVKSGHTEFTDHTTFLADQFGSDHVSMMFYSHDLKVILATIHISIRDVPRLLTKDAVRNAVNNALLFGRKFEGKDYRVAVCGLNPHAGENGLMGSEDSNIIAPVVEEFRSNGLTVDGPIPADTAFYRAMKKDYDIVASMYHDQGLAPFKLIHFNDGVNVTLGLPIVRTSPDHGTAFDIAGRNMADGKSMEKAMRLALKLTGKGPV
jgi:4-hydroxythreonine-4-phosphate dehydrogenase